MQVLHLSRDTSKAGLIVQNILSLSLSCSANDLNINCNHNRAMTLLSPKTGDDDAPCVRSRKGLKIRMRYCCRLNFWWLRVAKLLNEQDFGY